MTGLKILKYQLQDVLRSRWVVAWAAFFLLVTDALFRFGGDGEHVILSLLNLVLLLLPLMGLVLGAMYLYGSRESIELLLSHPVERRSLFWALYGGLVLPMAAAFALGVALPFLYHGALGGDASGALLLLILTGVLLTLVFVGLAYALALMTEDRIKGLGLALVAWLFLAVVFDGLILLVIGTFSAYPLQKPVIALSLLNPIDLGRILLLLNLDASALMGFTGAVFRRFFGTGAGQVITVTALLLWAAVPFAAGRMAFRRKNF